MICHACAPTRVSKDLYIFFEFYFYATDRDMGPMVISNSANFSVMVSGHSTSLRLCHGAEEDFGQALGNNTLGIIPTCKRRKGWLLRSPKGSWKLCKQAACSVHEDSISKAASCRFGKLGGSLEHFEHPNEPWHTARSQDPAAFHFWFIRT